MNPPILPEISDKLGEGLKHTLDAFRDALCSDHEDRFHTALEAARQHFDCECGLIARMQGETIAVEHVVGDGELRPGFHTSLKNTLCAVAFRGHEAVQISQLSTSPLATLRSIVQGPTERFLAIPLDVAGRRFGALAFYSATAGTAPSLAAEQKLLFAMASWVEHALMRSELGLDGRVSESASAEANKGPAPDRLQLTPEQTDTALGATGTAFFRYSPDTGFEWTRTLRHTLGHGPEVVDLARQAQWLLEQVHQDDREGLLGKLRSMSRGTTSGGTATLRVRSADGTFRTMKGTVYRVQGTGNGTSHFVGTLQDITAFRGRERRLRRQIDEFESFSKIVVHDILAPLRHASKLAAIVREDFSEALGTDGMRLINLIETSSSRGLAMLHALSGFNQSNTRPAPVELIGVRRLLEAITEEAVALYGRDGTTVRLPEHEVTMWSSRAELSLVLSNLVSNALKYGGSPPELVIEIDESTTHTTLRISDNGEGVPDGDKQRVFQPFFRRNPDGPQEGTGIGLATVQKLVLARSGRVWIEDRRETKGATVCLSYPHRTDAH